MSLEHINIWDENLGWKNITALEVRKTYSCSISHHTHKFLCDTCNQYVSFVVEKDNQFFRHPVGSRDCDDKQIQINNNKYRQNNKLGFSLPLKLNFKGNDIKLEIGFLPIEQSLMEECIKKGIRTRVKSENEILGDYIIDEDRFSVYKTSYISIGNNIRKDYEVKLSDDSTALKYIWPVIVDGIENSGTLFYDNGKRLSKNPDIVVNESYYVLTRELIYDRNNLNVSQILRTNNHWYLYKISPTDITESLAEFFLVRFQGRLIKKADNIVPIWPPYKLLGDNIIYHLNEFIFYHNNGFISLWPSNKISRYGPNIYCVDNFTKQSLLTISRNEDSPTVKKTYNLLLQEIKRTVVKYEFILSDLNDDIFLEDYYDVLPKSEIIKIKSSVDGYYKNFYDGKLIDIINIDANKEMNIKVQFNQLIEFYQGSDIVKKISFNKNEDFKNINDTFNKIINSGGRMIPVDHSFARYYYRLADNRIIRDWLKKCIKNGEISEVAFKKLKKLLINKK